MSVATPDDLLELIHAVMHAVRARQFERLSAAGLALTPMEGRFLGHVKRHRGVTQKDLVQHFGRDKAQVTRLVAGLRERGLLDGAEDQADRRVTRLNLTDEGRRLLAEISRIRRELSAAACRGLGDAERQQLADGLRHIAAQIERAS